ncbi:hypothetical protein [Coprococcus sp. RTP21281st1_F1_RTP21281_210402]|uniref:hypothetical protein n=1 Tax=Coprococcus sp. RTP21281st1_F1_RTP21281_210402 TaxID=3143208 RepID=UPI0034A4A895
MDTDTIAIFMVLVSILCMCLTIGISMIVYQVTHLKGIINKRYYKGLGVLHRINDEVDNEEKNKVETEKER